MSISNGSRTTDVLMTVTFAMTLVSTRDKSQDDKMPRTPRTITNLIPNATLKTLIDVMRKDIARGLGGGESGSLHKFLSSNTNFFINRLIHG